ncbi:CX domain-containing protein [Caenorhabditis elegans]|uniref:CX domain-containing protein n=2 Tax=Caenorhabditis elegans TaxID=6239 RepID=C8JQS0_CAEEL|nr:CX domain-containing protein [Caenorhabditis elegans]CBB16238.1 CX domain-containing protein [Caenorhabditis elegans]|eukprot:NP_001256327.1 Uncharacterized protein CELE_T11F9.21 [Caenorhabditis elegans]
MFRKFFTFLLINNNLHNHILFRTGYIEFSYLSRFLSEPRVIEHYFSYNNVTDIYSIDKHSIFPFNKNYYFFDDFYEPTENRTKVCIFKLYRHYEEIDHVVFSDGSRPKQIVFGCHSYQVCCEVGCCEINNYIYFWFLYPCAALMIAFACLARKNRENEAT